MVRNNKMEYCYVFPNKKYKNHRTNEYENIDLTIYLELEYKSNLVDYKTLKDAKGWIFNAFVSIDSKEGLSYMENDIENFFKYHKFIGLTRKEKSLINIILQMCKKYKLNDQIEISNDDGLYYKKIISSDLGIIMSLLKGSYL